MSLIQLAESKESKIRKLNLTDEQKETLINIFNKYNYLESKIDWNNPNLTWEAFEGVLSVAGKSKSSQKKHGIEGLTEDKDYRYIGKGYNDTIGKYKMYQPLTYEGSKTLASNRIAPVKENGAKWCISYQKTSKYWEDYYNRGILFLFIFTEKTKYAIAIYPEKLALKTEKSFEVYSFEDKNLGIPVWCTKDPTIKQEISDLYNIKVVVLTSKFGLIKNSDGTYDYKSQDISKRAQKYREKGYEVRTSVQSPTPATLKELMNPYIENGVFTIQLNRWETSFCLSALPLLKSLKGAPRYVKGNFICSNSYLTSLEGAPEYVEGTFDCSRNELTSLEGAPKYVGGDFTCSDNRLTSLKGAPKDVKGRFFCYRSSLTSLEGAPRKIEGTFGCSYNELTSLKGAPEYVGGNFDCYGNFLTSLEGSPKEVGRSFECSDNQLPTLKGAPEYVGGEFSCRRNSLISLIGAPEYVGGNFDCSRNELTSLEGSPGYVKSDFILGIDQLTSLKDLKSIPRDGVFEIKTGSGNLYKRVSSEELVKLIKDKQNS